MHGNTLAAGLRKAGADVLLTPLYTPLRTDEENLSVDHLALGGINVYLDETMPWWRADARLRAAIGRSAVARLLGGKDWAAARGPNNSAAWPWPCSAATTAR